MILIKEQQENILIINIGLTASIEKLFKFNDKNEEQHKNFSHIYTILIF